MPRFSDCFLPPTPKYRTHRASGQAVVTLYGRDFYLGPHGTKASRIEYDRLISEWLAAGRPSQMSSVQNDITVVELAAGYRKYAKSYYVKHGKPTDTIHQVKRATEIVCERYVRTNANEFGPLALSPPPCAYAESSQDEEYEQTTQAGLVPAEAGPSIHRLIVGGQQDGLHGSRLCSLNGCAGRRRTLRRQPGSHYAPFYHGPQAGTTGQASAQRPCGQPVLAVRRNHPLEPQPRFVLRSVPTRPSYKLHPARYSLRTNLFAWSRLLNLRFSASHSSLQRVRSSRS